MEIQSWIKTCRALFRKLSWSDLKLKVLPITLEESSIFEILSSLSLSIRILRLMHTPAVFVSRGTLQFHEENDKITKNVQIWLKPTSEYTTRFQKNKHTVQVHWYNSFYNLSKTIKKATPKHQPFCFSHNVLHKVAF